MGIEIIGTGRFIPPDCCTNEALTRVMDTTPDWIFSRTGIKQRYFAAPGVGVSDLGTEAARKAIARAGIAAEEIDYVMMATMTPDHHFPGPAAMVGARLGISGVPCLDVRQQCGSVLFQLQLANALMATGTARTILLIGADIHAGFMPWEDWDVLYGRSDRKPSPEAWERATRHRGVAVLFGDGAGAIVLRRTDDNRGLVSLDLHSDGSLADLILIPAGFKRHPYASPAVFAEELHIPAMKGKELFKTAVTRLPRSVRTACDRAGVSVGDVDLFVVHQANDRINEAVRVALGVPEAKVPGNVARYGNTSAGTIPILLDELNDEGRIKPGMLLCFMGLGSGLHWGTALFRT